MVSFLSVATLLISGALTATALPAASASAAADVAVVAATKRQSPVTIKYCTDEEGRGDCKTESVPLNSCHNIPPEFNDKISSFVLETKVLGDCIWYEHIDCSGQNYKKNEDKKLSDGNGKFNNFISSVLCTDANK